jgi:hypothetical protein
MLKYIYRNKLSGCNLDSVGSGSGPVRGFSVRNVETLGVLLKVLFHQHMHNILTVVSYTPTHVSANY